MTWAVPFWVTFGRRFQATLECAMALTDYQKAIVMPKVERVTNVRRLMAEGQEVAPCDDPEKHFVWSRQKGSRVGNLERARRADLDEFLAPMFLNGLGKSEFELEWWWNQFANHITWHLVNKETPIDFYIFKLHPSPLHPIWQMRRKRGRAGPMAFDGKTCLRTIDFELSRTWWRLTRRIERDRVDMLGRKEYATAVKAWLERYQATANRLYQQWILYRHIKSACVRRDCGPREHFRGMETSLEKSARSAARLAEAERERQKLKEKKRLERLYKQARDMRNVRAALRAYRKLRQTGRIVPGQSYGKNRDIGMLVPQRHEIPLKERKVLAARDGIPAGLVR